MAGTAWLFAREELDGRSRHAGGRRGRPALAGQRAGRGRRRRPAGAGGRPPPAGPALQGHPSRGRGGVGPRPRAGRPRHHARGPRPVPRPHPPPAPRHLPVHLRAGLRRPPRERTALRPPGHRRRPRRGRHRPALAAVSTTRATAPHRSRRPTPWPRPSRRSSAEAGPTAKASATTLGLDDVLVVAPYNAQVHLLAEHLPEGARIGTVDKFQGQEAPVVIVCMTASSAEDIPRGMEFLYSRNRLNVAVSQSPSPQRHGRQPQAARRSTAAPSTRCAWPTCCAGMSSSPTEVDSDARGLGDDRPVVDRGESSGVRCSALPPTRGTRPDALGVERAGQQRAGVGGDGAVLHGQRRGRVDPYAGRLHRSRRAAAQLRADPTFGDMPLAQKAVGGSLTTTVADTALPLDVMEEPDPRDRTGLPPPAVHSRSLPPPCGGPRADWGSVTMGSV